MVHGIVHNSGGTIVVDSRPGKGRKFSIYLPCIRETNKKEQLKRTEFKLPKGDERILFVDDELQITKMGNRILRDLGYRVDTYTNSSEVLQVFENDPDAYDLIISDMTMPKLTGIQLAEKMLGIKPYTKFILCTGFSKKINEDTINQMGIKALMLKSFANDELATVIRAILDE